jgi:multidrug efflux pump subunit AcrA (membrane-fusion protein)
MPRRARFTGRCGIRSWAPAAPGALAKAEADLLAARESVAEARRALARLADEARRLAEVRAPVDGQVLSVRVHVIHGSEGTAALRLLYRKTTQPPRAPGG